MGREGIEGERGKGKKDRKGKSIKGDLPLPNKERRICVIVLFYISQF